MFGEGVAALIFARTNPIYASITPPITMATDGSIRVKCPHPKPRVGERSRI